MLLFVYFATISPVLCMEEYKYEHPPQKHTVISLVESLAVSDGIYYNPGKYRAINVFCFVSGNLLPTKMVHEPRTLDQPDRKCFLLFPSIPVYLFDRVLRI